MHSGVRNHRLEIQITNERNSMRYLSIGAICVALVACRGNTQQGSQDTTQLKTQKDSVSYSIGRNIGNSFKQQSIDIDPDILLRGIKDVQTGNRPILTDEEVQAILAPFQARMTAKQEENMKSLAEKSKKEGADYLAQNKKKEGVVTLPSGLQYKVLKMGSGKKPRATETVKVNYRGTFIDAEEFDSSMKRGQPAAFACNAVIKGWGEALQMMPVGSKWQLFIPPELGYGERGAGQLIPPNATLVFEVELLSIK